MPIPLEKRQAIALRLFYKKLLDRPMGENRVVPLTDYCRTLYLNLPDKERSQGAFDMLPTFAADMIKMSCDSLVADVLSPEVEQAMRDKYHWLFDQLATADMLTDGFFLKQRKTQRLLQDTSARAGERSAYVQQYLRYHVDQVMTMQLHPYVTDPVDLDWDDIARKYMGYMIGTDVEGDINTMAALSVERGHGIVIDRKMGQFLTNQGVIVVDNNNVAAQFFLRFIPAVCEVLYIRH